MVPSQKQPLIEDKTVIHNIEDTYMNILKKKNFSMWNFLQFTMSV